jgi:2-polyprenyl-3-methyl-5-hydroxy-6-metoxy-1,4-benzoquinol methylase
MRYHEKYKDIKRTHGVYNLLMCPKCRLAKTDPFPKDSFMKELYSSRKYRDKGSRFIPLAETGIRFFRKFRQKRIERFIRKGRILDIGCGRGEFLSLLKERGWEAIGLELNEETASNARKAFGLEIRTGSLVDAQFEDNFFDVITLWHVLEHLPDPVQTMDECRRILKPGGLLVIALPHFDSLQARISGKYWFHLDLPYHLFHFMDKNMELFLRKFSLRVMKAKQFSFEFNPFGYLQSLLNMCHIEYNLLYTMLHSKALRDKLYSDMKRSRLYAHLFVTIVLLPLYAPLSLGFSLIESFLGRGGTIELYALKEG